MITIVTTVSDTNFQRTYGKSNFIVVENEYSNEDLVFLTQMVFKAISDTIKTFKENDK